MDDDDDDYDAEYMSYQCERCWGVNVENGYCDDCGYELYGDEEQMTEFDVVGKQFSARLQVSANWKQAYFGAAYSTRMQAAVSEARKACEELEQWMKANGEWYELIT